MKVQKINISPSYVDVLIMYARLYSKMNNQGKKSIERDLRSFGKFLDQQKQKQKGKK